jgi:hypothetical protein
MTRRHDGKDEMASETGNNQTASERPQRSMSDEQFEALLGEALRVDVPEPGEARKTAAPKQAAPARRKAPVLSWALAASLVLAVGATLYTLVDSAYFASDDLVADVMTHIDHEPAALAFPAAAVSEDSFSGVMQAAGVSMSPIDGKVTYVKLCPFRGEMVAHFALSGANGPVTVMLLPNEQVDQPMMVDEEGFQGTIAPLSIGGSIAVVGEPGEDIQDIQNRVADAVRWRL